MVIVPLSACGKKTDETQRAAGITPESAVAFASISLSPSVEQQANLVRFANTVAQDDFNFESSKDDFGQSVVDDVFGGELSYDEDFKSWIGSEVSVAAFVDVPEDSGDDIGVAVIVDVTDEAVAESSLQKIKDNNEVENFSEIEWQIINGKAVIVDSDSRGQDDAWVLERFVALEAGDGKSLAEVDRFTELDDELASDRLFYGFVDFQKAQSDFRGFEESGCELNAAGTSTVMSALRAEPDALRLQVAAAGAQESSKVSDRLSRLPEGTVGAFSFATGPLDLEALLTENSLQCDDQDLSVDYDEVFGDFEDETGVDVQRHIVDWFSGDMTLVLGSRTTNDDQALPNEFGIVTSAANIDDKSARLTESIEKFEDLARYALAQSDCFFDFDTGEENCVDPDDVVLPFSFDEVTVDGASLAYEVVFEDSEALSATLSPVFAVSDDAFVLASNAEYATLLLGDGDGSAIAEIGSQVLDGDGDVTFAGVIDLDATADFAEDLIGDNDTRESRDFLDGLRRFDTFEFSARTKGSISVFDGKLSLDE
jgi:hypothetical protein